MKTLYESTYTQINFNREFNAIELIWKNVATEQIYKDTLLKGLELLINESATSWISDIRKQGVIGSESSQWLQKSVIPKAIDNGLKKIGIVMNEDGFKKFYIDNIKKNVKDNSLLQYFKSMEDAYNWIKS